MHFIHVRKEKIVFVREALPALMLMDVTQMTLECVVSALMSRLTVHLEIISCRIVGSKTL